MRFLTVCALAVFSASSGFAIEKKFLMKTENGAEVAPMRDPNGNPVWRVNHRDEMIAKHNAVSTNAVNLWTILDFPSVSLSSDEVVVSTAILGATVSARNVNGVSFEDLVDALSDKGRLIEKIQEHAQNISKLEKIESETNSLVSFPAKKRDLRMKLEFLRRQYQNLP